MSFVSWFFILYFVNDLLLYNFPKEHATVAITCISYVNDLFALIEPYTISTMIQLLYCYSVMEIKYNKVKKYLKPYLLEGKRVVYDYLNSHTNNSNTNNPYAFYTKTSIDTYDVSNNFTKVDEHRSTISLLDHTDFLKEYYVVEEQNHYYVVNIILEEDKTNKIVFQNAIMNDNKLVNTCSNVQFISLCLQVKGIMEPIEMHLKTEDVNYYMVTNKIDKHFVYYYVKYHAKINYCSSFTYFTYILEVMDNNVNIFTITEKDSIYIDEDTYLLHLHKEELEETKTTKEIKELSNRCKTESFGEPEYIKL